MHGGCQPQHVGRGWMVPVYLAGPADALMASMTSMPHAWHSTVSCSTRDMHRTATAPSTDRFISVIFFLHRCRSTCNTLHPATPLLPRPLDRGPHPTAFPAAPPLQHGSHARNSSQAHTLCRPAHNRPSHCQQSSTPSRQRQHWQCIWRHHHGYPYGSTWRSDCSTLCTGSSTDACSCSSSPHPRTCYSTWAGRAAPNLCPHHQAQQRRQQWQQEQSPCHKHHTRPKESNTCQRCCSGQG